jgi:nucleotide-binding universal stress UspA family protein
LEKCISSFTAFLFVAFPCKKISHFPNAKPSYMKTILIPTDFSTSADNATIFAAHLAQQINAALLLVHVYQIPVTMNDMPVMVLSADELRRSADEQLARLQREMELQFPGLPVTVESRLGSINDELEDICRQANPVALVLGTHGASGLERMLFGSTTLSVMRHTNLPVIAVPKDHKRYGLRKIVLAADLLDVDKIPARRITEVTQQLGATLDLVHVSVDNNATTQEPAKLLELLQPLQPEFHTVQAKNVKEGLVEYLHETGADLLMVLPHEHNIIERLFFKLHTDDILQNAPVPVMAIRC